MHFYYYKPLELSAQSQKPSFSYVSFPAVAISLGICGVIFVPDNRERGLRALWDPPTFTFLHISSLLSAVVNDKLSLRLRSCTRKSQSFKSGHYICDVASTFNL